MLIVLLHLPGLSSETLKLFASVCPNDLPKAPTFVNSDLSICSDA